MGSLLYLVLLRLLPRARRDRYGHEMAETFAAMRDDARADRRRPLALGALWMRETRGIVRVSFLDRRPRVAALLRGIGSLVPKGGGGVRQELKWAWRGVRARGARAWLVAGLLGVAIAANTLVFAVADSVVFNRVPYPRAQEIVEIRSADGPASRDDRSLSAPLLDAWRAQTDLFASVQAYLAKNIFVVANGRSEIVPAVDITPGLLELLGVRPAFGRSFTVDDTLDLSRIPALISAELAAELYGDARAAIGRPLETTSSPLIVVGVMPKSFAFPQASHKLWRVFDPHGPLARGFGGAQSIARIVPGLSFEKLDESPFSSLPASEKSASAWRSALVDATSIASSLDRRCGWSSPAPHSASSPRRRSVAMCSRSSTACRPRTRSPTSASRQR